MIDIFDLIAFVVFGVLLVAAVVAAARRAGLSLSWEAALCELNQACCPSA